MYVKVVHVLPRVRVTCSVCVHVHVLKVFRWNKHGTFTREHMIMDTDSEMDTGSDMCKGIGMDIT